MIAIIKYRAGNTASVANALSRLNVDFFFAETPAVLDKATGVIFPGVGHAYAAMESLKESKMDEWLKKTKKPVLGICVGMQLLFESSTEGDTNGLGVIPGRLQKFESNTEKVPHMGWNTLNSISKHPLTKGINSNNYLYFVHSYFAPISEYSVANCSYAQDFIAIVAKDNFMGVQFHPEKSSDIGALVLQNFVNLVYTE
ncbi:MAG: imidazole glycerol phosphate synthase subunit HisH [Balneolaceae bacterium]